MVREKSCSPSYMHIVVLCFFVKWQCDIVESLGALWLTLLENIHNQVCSDYDYFPHTMC